MEDWAQYVRVSVGDTIDVTIECSCFDISPGETMWLVLNQAEFDSSWDVVDKYHKMNSLHRCQLLTRMRDGFQPYNWRRWKKIDAIIRVKVLQSIPFRHFGHYFSSPTIGPNSTTVRL